MAILRNHPAFWIRDDAEASLARWEADHGIISVNSAGRYEWEQQELIDRWNQGGTYNRPPYLYEPKRPAWMSEHVANGGRAFDTSEWRRFLATCADYGWLQVHDWDVVHFEYFPERDKYRDRPAGGGSTPTAPTTPEEEEEEEMAMKGLSYKRSTDGAIIVAKFNELSGFYQETEGTTGDYNTPIAQAWEIRGAEANGGSWPLLSESDVMSLKRSLAEVRQGK